MKTDEILKKLRDAEGYVSGQELCEYYGVSRTAIWKAIKQLEKEGYTIEAQSNKGYRLVEASGIDVFSKVEIESQMDTNWVGKKLVFHKETGSTNLDAKKLADEGAASGALVVADMQTAGRGRRGRDWVSPAGKDIYMTLMLRPECRPDKASALTLVMALAVLEGIQDVIKMPNGASLGIKWPNDIVINNKKTCGILTEMSAELDGIHYVVIGVGINVNQTEFAEDIRNTATSMYIESGEKINRSKLVARVMHYFEEDYEIFANTWDLTGLVDKYNKYLVNCGKEVRVLDPKGEYDAFAEGINENGELIVRRKDNDETVLVYAGEVSVRGVYGYAI
jgi:BirA family biotin operon repressor/biotin-[acetyl-CoA-carboxylase] ligase